MAMVDVPKMSWLGPLFPKYSWEKLEAVKSFSDSLLNHRSLQRQRKFAIFLDNLLHLSSDGGSNRNSPLVSQICDLSHESVDQNDLETRRSNEKTQ
jgi:hypothetical protein